MRRKVELKLTGTGIDDRIELADKDIQIIILTVLLMYKCL